MCVSARTTRVLWCADDMELAAADAATLVGAVAALANEDGSGSSRTRTPGGRSCRSR